MSFEKYDPKKSAQLVEHYIINMTDEANDRLPYWLILPNKKPAEAAHCRVDDAELVGSWYEGIDSAIHVLGKTEENEEVRQALRRHLMKSWGEHGLRFSEPYLWTHTIHSSFHEMGYILPALNRITESFPDDEEAEKRTSELIKGMRSLVIERKVRTFWSGDSEEKEPVYEFPNDVFLKDGGFDLSRHTGRGEQPIRNAIMLRALVKRYELKKDETALDLAIGLANFVLGVSRYFNYRMEFFGHVHSALWFATGLAALGRVTKKDEYIQKARHIYAYVRSISSSFGWVPEYAQWHPMDEEHCETCCIKDMIECAVEFIGLGYDEYWDDVNKFARNQLVENQVRYTGYVTVDNTLPDSNGITYRDIDKRIIGGFTGGSEPNSMSLERFRSIAGCCVGMAPVALALVWDNAVTQKDDKYVVNIPFDKETDKYTMKSYIPDEGRVSLTLKDSGAVGFRLYDWNKNFEIFVDSKKTDYSVDGSVAFVENVNAGSTVEIVFPIETVAKKELVRGTEFTVYWRACDVVDITPRGNHVRLYQRDNDKEKYYPLPEDVKYTGAVNMGPTQQSSKSGKA